MKPSSSIKTAVIFFCLFLLFSGGSLWGQPENPNNPAPLPGAVILLAAGAAYGAKKYHGSRKES